MTFRHTLGAALLTVAAALPSLTGAQSADLVFANGFDPVLPTEAEAARFLNRATFGATPADIQFVRNQGFEAWLEQQFAAPRTLHRRPLEELALTLPANTAIDRNDRLRQWYRVAVLAPDQLRQRMAFALSQIVVTSDLSDALSGEPLLMAEWNDLLARHAFGNYRDLLHDVTRSPAMGRYLTHIRNRKVELTGTPPNQMATVTPDENYAREVMQLFSIGLVERNLDFSPILVGGQPVSTYDNDMIAALSRVFTGLAYDCTGTAEIFPGAGVSIVRNCAGTGPACTGTDCRFTNTGTLFFNNPPTDGTATNLIPDTTPVNRGLRHPDWFRPMVCYPRYHDTGRQASGNNPVGTPPAPWTGVPPQPPAAKPLVLGGQTLLTINPIPSPSQTAPNRALNCNDTGTSISAAHRAECLAYCENSIDQAVNLLFAHPNTSTFVARQLIQRFVTSNPSPAYIRRVACAFEGNQAPPAQCGTPGSHARGDLRQTIRAVLLDPDALRPFGDAGLPLNFGKAREPILKLTQLWRSMGAVMPPLAGRNWGPTSPQTTFAQRPLGAPSVFNFFEPDYKQAGTISSVDIQGNPSTTGLYSPEFQILNEVSLIDTANELWNRVCAGYGSNNCQGAFVATPPTDRAYIPPESLDALPIADGTAASDVALIEALNVRLMGGTMSGTINQAATCPTGTPTTAMLGTGMKGRLYGMLRCTTFNTLNANQNDRRRKALLLIHLILISPEYNTQR
jgi:uncharacterized protein (DUF1800 family)